MEKSLLCALWVFSSSFLFRRKNYAQILQRTNERKTVEDKVTNHQSNVTDITREIYLQPQEIVVHP